MGMTIEPLRRHGFEPKGEGGAGRARVVVDLVGSRDAVAEPTGKRGRPPVFTDAATRSCWTLTAVFGLLLRQTTGMVASLPGLAGLDGPVPDFSTLCRRRKTLTVHIPHRPGPGALHLLIESTGVKAEGDDDWSGKKHGPSKPRDWRKVHLGIDAKTASMPKRRESGPSKSQAAASAMRPCGPICWSDASGDQPLGMVTAEGAHDTRAGHAAIAARGAAAVIPPRKNGKPRKEHTAAAAVRNAALRSRRRLGRAIRKRRTGYHRRRPVEAKMRCCKLKGQRLSARDCDRQAAELQMRTAIWNRFTAIATPLTRRVG
jgi:hypothetical protein